MLNRRLVFLLPVLVCTVGCTTQSFMSHMAPETTQEAKTNFDYLRHHQYDKIEPSLDPSIDRAGLNGALDRMAALVPSEEPLSIKTVGANEQCETGKGCSTRVTLEYQFPSKWLLVEMVVNRQDQKAFIFAFHITPESESLEQLNQFTLRGKRKNQYIVLAAAIGSLALMVYALVLCIRTRLPKRKSLWIILILFGVSEFGVDWTTGETFHRVFWINLLPAGLSRQIYGPWTVSVSIPLGALLFLIFRDRLRRAPAPPPDGSLALAPVYHRLEPRPEPGGFATPASSHYDEHAPTNDLP